MNYIGFIKEHDDIKEALYFNDFIKNNDNHIHTSKIIDYLNSGILILGWMGYSRDFKTNELIAPKSYKTDGFNLWPAYLSHYIGKYPDFNINQEFLEYMLLKNFKIDINISEKEKEKIEKELSNILNDW